MVTYRNQGPKKLQKLQSYMSIYDRIFLDDFIIFILFFIFISLGCLAIQSSTLYIHKSC